MRKFFTLTLCSLALGAFSANAATTTITPTISPASVLEIGEWWPNQITVEWDGQSVELNTGNANYDGGYIGSIPLYINGTHAIDEWGDPVYLNARAVYWEGTYWDDASEENSGTALAISGFPFFDSAPTEGEYMEFTLPADCVFIGANKDTNPEMLLKFSIGEVDYDDTVVKTFGSSVEFTGPNKVDFSTRLNEPSNMCVVSNVDVNLANYISMTYTPNISGDYKTSYKFNTVKMDDGNYAYNFENVTDDQCVFEYSGQTAVTFTFQQDWEEGEQEGGLVMGDAEWGEPFQAGPKSAQRFILTLPDGVDDECFIQISSSTNYAQQGTLQLLSSGDFDLMSAWKVSNAYQLIAGKNGNYGYTGHLNISAGSSISLVYTGSEDLTITVGTGQYIEGQGIPEYMPQAILSPSTVSTSNTNAGVEITWNQEVTVVEAAPFTLYFGDEIDGSIIETRNYFQFVTDEEGDTDSGDPDDTTDSADDIFTAGQSGEIIRFLFGAAVNNEPQVGTYTFTLPVGIVKNANGDLNPKQTFTITVVSPTIGAVSPAEGYEFEADENVEFTIQFDGEPVINASEDDPIVITYMQDAEYVKRVEWADDVLYIDGNTIYLNLGSASEFNAGTYYLSLLEGAVTVDGNPNELIDNYRFVINAPEQDETIGIVPIYPALTPDPREDYVEPFTSITLVWNGYTPSINSDNETSATFDGNVVLGTISGNALVFEVEAATTGTYSLILPAEFVILTDEDGVQYYNASGNYVFVVDADPDGIQVVGADANGLFNVVNLNGVKVLSTKNASEVKNLPAGVYIINGKKVAVK